MGRPREGEKERVRGKGETDAWEGETKGRNERIEQREDWELGMKGWMTNKGEAGLREQKVELSERDKWKIKGKIKREGEKKRGESLERGMNKRGESEVWENKGKVLREGQEWEVREEKIKN